MCPHLSTHHFPNMAIQSGMFSRPDIHNLNTQQHVSNMTMQSDRITWAVEPASATNFPVGGSAADAPHPTFAYYHFQGMQQLNQQFSSMVIHPDSGIHGQSAPYSQYYADPATDVFMQPRSTS